MKKEYKMTEEKMELYNKARKMPRYLCHFCKKHVIKSCKRKNLEFGGNTIHHKIPRRFGGKDVQNNLICICDSCHNKLERLIKISENALINSQSNEKENKNEK